MGIPMEEMIERMGGMRSEYAGGTTTFAREPTYMLDDALEHHPTIDQFLAGSLLRTKAPKYVQKWLEDRL
jgi:hypothetical protein